MAPQRLDGFSAVIRASNTSDNITRVPFAAYFYNFNEEDMPAYSCPYVARFQLPQPISVAAEGMVNLVLVNPSNTPVKMLAVRPLFLFFAVCLFAYILFLLCCKQKGTKSESDRERRERRRRKKGRRGREREERRGVEREKKTA